MKKPPLSTEMRCSLVSNKHGDIVLLHENPLHDEVDWIEFHPSQSSLTIIYTDGITQEFGHPVEAGMAQNIQHGTMVQVTLIQEKIIKQIQKTTFLIQDY